MTKSIYDQLNAYGTVAKQRFVEDFSGWQYDDDRWGNETTHGSITFGMADTDEGGFTATTGGADSDSGTINFSNKTQYSPTGAVMISVWKKDIVNCAGITGFKNATGALYPTSQCSYVRNGNTSSYVELLSGAGTITSQTDSTTATSEAFHNYKLELITSGAELTYDGTLIVTKTDHKPTSALQPFTGVQKRSGTGVAILTNRYMECYNT